MFKKAPLLEIELDGDNDSNESVGEDSSDPEGESDIPASSDEHDSDDEIIIKFKDFHNRGVSAKISLTRFLLLYYILFPFSYVFKSITNICFPNKGVKKPAEKKIPITTLPEFDVSSRSLL